MPRRAFAVAACFAFAATVRPGAPARAEVRFCNQSATDSLVVEGHFTKHDGLTVTGTYVVKKRTCGVIVPGPLTGRSYFLHVVTNGEAYGDHHFRLCTADLAHFTFDDEDKSTFHCSGGALPPGLHIAGFANAPLYLADFMRFITNGESTLVLTMSPSYEFHYKMQ